MQTSWNKPRTEIAIQAFNAWSLACSVLLWELLSRSMYTRCIHVSVLFSRLTSQSIHPVTWLTKAGCKLETRYSRWLHRLWLASNWHSRLRPLEEVTLFLFRLGTTASVTTVCSPWRQRTVRTCISAAEVLRIGHMLNPLARKCSKVWRKKLLLLL